MSLSASTTVARPQTATAISKHVQALASICFGLVVVGFVGFSHIEIVHNAAHDTRHANAFPCH